MRYILSRNEERLFLFKSAKSKLIPDVMIKTNDGLPLHSSQSVTFMRIKKTGGWHEKSIFNDLKQKGVDIREVIGKFATASTDCFNFFRPDGILVFQEIGVKNIYLRFLDMSNSHSFYEQIFSSAYKPDLAQHQSGGANLIIPDKTRKSSREAILSDFRIAYERLTEYGFGYIVDNINVSFLNLPEKIIGRHCFDTNGVEITLRRSGLVRQMATVHEFGHSLWNNRMNTSDHNLIKEKFTSLKLSGAHMNDRKMREEIYYKATGIDKYAINDSLQYIGPMRALSGRVGTLTRVEGNKFYVKFDTESYICGIGHIERFKRPDEPEPQLSIAEREDALIHKASPYDGWFPSRYSEVGAEEWFCENFSFMAFGYAQNPDLIEFYEDILDKHRIEPRLESTRKEDAYIQETNALGQYGFNF